MAILFLLSRLHSSTIRQTTSSSLWKRRPLSDLLSQTCTLPLFQGTTSPSLLKRPLVHARGDFFNKTFRNIFSLETNALLNDLPLSNPPLPQIAYLSGDVSPMEMRGEASGEFAVRGLSPRGDGILLLRGEGGREADSSKILKFGCIQRL